MTVYRIDGRLYMVAENPKKRKKRVCGPKCKARIKRELHRHAKEAARESISGAIAMLAGIALVGALTRGSTV